MSEDFRKEDEPKCNVFSAGLILVTIYYTNVVEGCAPAKCGPPKVFRELKVVNCLWHGPIHRVPGGEACVFFFWSPKEYNLSGCDCALCGRSLLFQIHSIKIQNEI